MVIAQTEEVLRWLREGLEGTFMIKWKDGVESLIGMEIKRQEAGFTLTQKQLIESIVATNWDGRRLGNTPLPPKHKVCSLGKDKTIIDQKPFLSIIGSSSYVVNGTWPDISFAVNLLVQHMQAPGRQHWTLLQHLLGYLHHTQDQGLRLFPNDEHITVSSDVSWGGEFSRSTHGYLLMVHGCAVAWSLKRLMTVASSTSHAEYMALSLASQQGMWLKRLIHDVFNTTLNLLLQCDNKSAIRVSNDSGSNKRTRHSDRDFYIVNEMLYKKEATLEWFDKVKDIHLNLGISEKAFHIRKDKLRVPVEAVRKGHAKQCTPAEIALPAGVGLSGLGLVLGDDSFGFGWQIRRLALEVDGRRGMLVLKSPKHRESRGTSHSGTAPPTKRWNFSTVFPPGSIVRSLRRQSTHSFMMILASSHSNSEASEVSSDFDSTSTVSTFSSSASLQSDQPRLSKSSACVPSTGVGWKLGNQQIHPNIYRRHPNLSNSPPHSSVLVSQSPHKAFDSSSALHPSHHDEFGHDDLDDEFLWTSRFQRDTHQYPHEDGNYWSYLTTYWSYLLVFLIGHLRDRFGKIFYSESYQHLKPINGYAALNSDFGSFFTRRVKSRLDDCFSRPVTGTPARTITLIDRTSDDNCSSFKYTGQTTQALNISSYNYLGFAQSHGRCADYVHSVINQCSINISNSPLHLGTTLQLIQTEKLLASFLGVESAMLISQGFATNSTTMPALVSKGALVISDELNHASIRFGTRLSGVMVRTFKHNDLGDLERVLREAISQGQPKKPRSWTKILVIVEGIFSMEGTIIHLPKLLQLRDKYKFYLYIDEAHSIGALGSNGKGVCDYYGIDPARVDVLMGTLTKSFGASGGYIAGKKSLVDHMRNHCHSSVYGEALSPAVLAQIASAIQSIVGTPHISNNLTLNEGQRRLRRLAFNARYLHAGLRKLGFIVTGNRDAPVVPLIVFQPGKMLLFSRLMLQRYSIVVVIVGYPATPLVLGRVRFCVSAAHTKSDLDRILIAADDIGGALGMKLGKLEKRMNVEDVISNAKYLVAN
ncbi:hypothetical protein O181_047017 [Austropuccinia psidii MF-1]|uniref:serine C-palmitoyltransferase n=1 Tax=Austropuccinia psidii MF-1 TaxID=1389203 RepID=A0A9Q3DX13_9BASI|nr:hypothetical protein [Austropuccinia psidii MF-1]